MFSHHSIAEGQRTLMSYPQVQAIRNHLAAQFNLPLEQIDSLMPSFIATLGKHMHGLEQALAEEDAQRIGKAGHTIKGAFLNLGMGECAKVAMDIEEKGRNNGPIHELRSLIEKLRKQLSSLLE